MPESFPCWMCKSAGTCDRCRRLYAIGDLVVATVRLMIADIEAAWRLPVLITENTAIDDAAESYRRNLDAIALLLIDRGRLVREHRKELREEIREAQHGARAAYDEGRRDSEDWGSR